VREQLAAKKLSATAAIGGCEFDNLCAVFANRQ
jgi:hypothetical protein